MFNIFLMKSCRSIILNSWSILRQCRLRRPISVKLQLKKLLKLPSVMANFPEILEKFKKNSFHFFFFLIVTEVQLPRYLQRQTLCYWVDHGQIKELVSKDQKEPSIDVLQLYWNCTWAWVFSCKFVVYFQNTFTQQNQWQAASQRAKGQKTTNGDRSIQIRQMWFESEVEWT